MSKYSIRYKIWILLAVVSIGIPGYAAKKPVDRPGAIIEISGANPRATRLLYGQNYWCWDAYGDEVHQIQEPVRQLQLNLLRAGGYNNDAQASQKFDPFDRAQVDEFVSYCRAIGVEPLLQVSLLKNIYNQPATAEDAADWVRYCNVMKQYGIKYWSIGNEPECYAGKDKPSYQVQDFCNDFHRFSQAMKAVDPTIKILGPEVAASHYYPQTGAQDWLTPFLIRCKGDFDILTLHRYPFDGANCTVPNALNDRDHFRDVIRGVRRIMHEQQLDQIPLGFTEVNVTWDGDPKHTNTASPPTFYAALWLADSLGVALEENIWTMAYWSLCEGWPLGFLESQTHKKRPIYYVFQMYTSHFGTEILEPVAVPKNFSVYASRNAKNDGCVLMVINKNRKHRRALLRFRQFEPRLADREYEFPGYSITCLNIPDEGGAMQVLSYTKAMADRGLGPQIVPENQ